MRVHNQERRRILDMAHCSGAEHLPLDLPSRGKNTPKRSMQRLPTQAGKQRLQVCSRLGKAEDESGPAEV